jgi:hypothetical protein
MSPDAASHVSCFQAQCSGRRRHMLWAIAVETAGPRDTPLPGVRIVAIHVWTSGAAIYLMQMKVIAFRSALHADLGITSPTYWTNCFMLGLNLPRTHHISPGRSSWRVMRFNRLNKGSAGAGLSGRIDERWRTSRAGS